MLSPRFIPQSVFYTDRKVKVFFLVQVYVFNFDLFEFSAAILEKGLFRKIIPNEKNQQYNLANKKKI